MATRCAILGAGGMGSAFAAFLARAGRDVVLIGRGGAHVERIAAEGLRVTPPDGEPYRLPLRVAAAASGVAAGSADVLIVLTKAYDTDAACAAARHVLAPGGVAVTLQNGLGGDRSLAAVFGAGRSLAGVTTVGATRIGPGEISITDPVRTVTHVGPTRAATGAAHARAVAGLLTGAGVRTLHVPDADVPIWEKLAMAVMSPISSLLRLDVGETWRRPAAPALIETAFDEVMAVAVAEGVAVDRERAWDRARANFESAGEHHTSMCEDVLHGRRTELAQMSGEVERRAAAHGLATPVHTTLLRLLRAQGVT